MKVSTKLAIIPNGDFLDSVNKNMLGYWVYANKMEASSSLKISSEILPYQFEPSKSKLADEWSDSSYETVEEDSDDVEKNWLDRIDVEVTWRRKYGVAVVIVSGNSDLSSVFVAQN